MALPATHVRYALAQMPSGLEPQRRDVVAGTLYPDSRMLSGLPRSLTHSDTCLADTFPTSAFRLGWQLHCRCDRIQADVHARIWPAAARLIEPNRWVAMSAAKMIQDETDLACTPMATALSGLTRGTPPFGEDPAAISQFFLLIRNLYTATDLSPSERYIRLWAGVGLEAAMIDRLLQAYADLKADIALAERIAGSMAALLDG